jgi:hypothetical protein
MQLHNPPNLLFNVENHFLPTTLCTAIVMRGQKLFSPVESGCHEPSAAVKNRHWVIIALWCYNFCAVQLIEIEPSL